MSKMTALIRESSAILLQFCLIALKEERFSLVKAKTTIKPTITTVKPLTTTITASCTTSSHKPQLNILTLRCCHTGVVDNIPQLYATHRVRPHARADITYSTVNMWSTE